MEKTCNSYYHPGFEAIFERHAQGPTEYAKLLFWGFVAEFNEKCVTNVIDSIRQKSLIES